MRWILRGAAALLAAAAALGLARTAFAQSASPAPAGPTTTDSVEADDVPALPRVLPPHAARQRPMLAPLTDEQVSAMSGDQTPASPGNPPPTPSPAAKPPVDLLVPPALPQLWSQQGNPAPLAVMPSGLPAGPAANYYADPRPVFPLLARFFKPATVPAADPYADAVLRRQAIPHAVALAPVAPTAVPASIAASAGPTEQPAIKAGAAVRSWPPAFATREEPPTPETQAQPPEIQTADYIEKSPAQAKAPPTTVPAHPNDLKKRVEAACGRDAVKVIVTPRPDGNVQVIVRVHDAAAEAKVADKILALPEMTVPSVHLVLEVEP